MLRIITGFILLIISQISLADTIPASTSQVLAYYNNSFISSANAVIGPTAACTALGNVWNTKTAATSHPYVSYTASGVNIVCTFNAISVSTGAFLGTNTQTMSGLYVTTYSCSSPYFLSDNAGNASSSGQYCTKSACADYAGTTTDLWFARNSVPNTGCYAGCKATATVAVNYGASSVEMPYVYQSFKISDEVCSGVMAYTDAATAQAANKAAQDAADLQAQKDACGAAGWTSGTSNGQTVITCKTPDSTSNTGTSTGTDSASSGVGTDAGSPETNTSGTQNSTVGAGDFGNTGTSSGGTSSGAVGGTGSAGTGSTGTGTDSGTSTGAAGTGTDSGSSSGTSGTGTDSGSSSDSGSGASGSGAGSGTGTGSGSGSGTGTDSGGSGTGATSGAGGTGTGTDTNEESDSGSASSSDDGYSYSDTKRDGRTFTQIFSSHFDELKQTQLFGSASGFFKVSFNGSCSPIEMPFFNRSITVDICSFFDRWSIMVSAIVIFACSVFAFRTAME